MSDAAGNQQPSGVVLLKLQTLKDEYGYWLIPASFDFRADRRRAAPLIARSITPGVTTLVSAIPASQPAKLVAANRRRLRLLGLLFFMVMAGVLVFMMTSP